MLSDKVYSLSMEPYCLHAVQRGSVAICEYKQIRHILLSTNFLLRKWLRRFHMFGIQK